MQASEIKVIGWVDDPDTYPIQPKPHTMEFLREVAHLRPRTNVIGATTRVRHTLAMAIHRFFHEDGFFWVNTPIITASDAEGAGELFRVSTLDLVNLPRTPDGKDRLRAGLLRPRGLPHRLGPAQRRDLLHGAVQGLHVRPDVPRRELQHQPPPRGVLDDRAGDRVRRSADDATLAERLLKYIFKAVLDERPDDMAFFEERIEKGVIAKLQGIVDKPFVRMDYTEAIRILEKAKREVRVPGEVGHGPAERARALPHREARRRPVILMNYPKEIKAFYMRLNDDGKTVAAMDVLAPGIGEIIGGSQREERLDVLDRRIAESGLDPNAYGWYRDLRRYGTVPHAGFGLGFERTVAYVTGLANVRDVIPFPRTPGNARRCSSPPKTSTRCATARSPRARRSPARCSRSAAPTCAPRSRRSCSRS